MYEATSNISGYFSLREINNDLVQRNVELELQNEFLKKKLAGFVSDSLVIEQMDTALWENMRYLRLM